MKAGCFLPFCVAGGLLTTAIPGHAQNGPTENPRWTTVRDTLSVPAGIEAKGEHRSVVIEGDVVEGRIANAVLAKSSGVDALDAFALRRFATARLSSDLLENAPTKVRLTFEFSTPGHELDFGSEYPCAQAVLDADWYARAFPGEGIEPTSLYNLIAGAAIILDRKEFAFASNKANYDRIWQAAIERCRTFPQDVFLRSLLAVSKK